MSLCHSYATASHIYQIWAYYFWWTWIGGGFDVDSPKNRHWRKVWEKPQGYCSIPAFHLLRQDASCLLFVVMFLERRGCVMSMLCWVNGSFLGFLRLSMVPYFIFSFLVQVLTSILKWLLFLGFADIYVCSLISLNPVKVLLWAHVDSLAVVGTAYIVLWVA